MEMASNYPPRRMYDEMLSHAPQKYIESHPIENYGENNWIDTVGDTDYGYYGNDYSFDGIYLPTGTIEKLIGEKMTWEDEPREFNPNGETVLFEKHFDSLEEKCRYYQFLSDYRLREKSFILVHVDGRSFSRLVKNRFKQPFDDDFIGMMNETAKFLCENVTGVKFAYAQSDEITLVVADFDEEGNFGEHFFGGRLCKMQSIIASLATSQFNRLYTAYTLKHDKTNRTAMEIISEIPLAQFDCKCWNVNNANDAFAWVLYRQIDCVRNSKQHAAQTYFSHNQLLGKDTDAQVQMLKDEKGIDWNDYEDGKKYGRFLLRREFLLSRVNQDGTTDNFSRKKWVVEDGYDITDEGNRKKFYEDNPIFKIVL
jgi:tRNA(His) 5'-end guanylyltransferase